MRESLDREILRKSKQKCLNIDGVVKAGKSVPELSDYYIVHFLCPDRERRNCGKTAAIGREISGTTHHILRKSRIRRQIPKAYSILIEK